MIESLKRGEDYICFLEKDTRLPMLYIEDAILGTIKLMSSKKKNLNVKESYNITGFSITPEELELKLKENGCIGMLYTNQIIEMKLPKHGLKT
jgi:nucleoside-diphosphate-sugar epimerase